MKDVILGTVCLFLGVAIGYFGSTPKTVVEEKIVEVEKIVEMHGVPVNIKAVEGVHDLRPTRDAVDAQVVFDKEVPNGYGLLVVDLKSGGYVKLKMMNNQGPNLKWGGPVNKLLTQWSPKQLGIEANDIINCTARFYSSDFPPEVLKK